MPLLFLINYCALAPIYPVSLLNGMPCSSLNMATCSRPSGTPDYSSLPPIAGNVALQVSPAFYANLHVTGRWYDVGVSFYPLSNKYCWQPVWWSALKRHSIEVQDKEEITAFYAINQSHKRHLAMLLYKLKASVTYLNWIMHLRATACLHRHCIDNWPAKHRVAISLVLSSRNLVTG